MADLQPDRQTEKMATALSLLPTQGLVKRGIKHRTYARALTQVVWLTKRNMFIFICMDTYTSTRTHMCTFTRFNTVLNITTHFLCPNIIPLSRLIYQSTTITRIHKCDPDHLDQFFQSSSCGFRGERVVRIRHMTQTCTWMHPHNVKTQILLCIRSSSHHNFAVL